MVKHEETGLVFPAGDEDALANCLKTVVANATLARAMGERGRARFLEQFHVDRMTERTRQLYRRFFRSVCLTFVSVRAFHIPLSK